MQLSCLLLMAAAAVPLLGEPQINKQTNEAKATRPETKATRQENRNTIREGESLSSCPTGSTSFTHDDERSPLLMELPRSAKLFGQPGTRHRIPVTVTNRGSAPNYLMLSHQEAFLVNSLDSFGTHVELVAGIQPAEVEVGAQSSVTVHVMITVSSYVPPLFRSKVTVSARPLVSNQTEENHHRHHADLSFYFAVVEPGRTLAYYDLTPPTCSVLCMDQCLPGDCQGWTARVSLHDGSTGLGWTRLVWPQDQNLVVSREGDWPMGTKQPSTISIQAPCCQKGVLLEQSDLAGQTVMCRIGEVANMGSSGKLLKNLSFDSHSNLGNKPIDLLLFLCNIVVAFAFEC